MCGVCREQCDEGRLFRFRAPCGSKVTLYLSDRRYVFAISLSDPRKASWGSFMRVYATGCLPRGFHLLACAQIHMVGLHGSSLSCQQWCLPLPIDQMYKASPVGRCVTRWPSDRWQACALVVSSLLLYNADRVPPAGTAGMSPMAVPHRWTSAALRAPRASAPGSCAAPVGRTSSPSPARRIATWRTTTDRLHEVIMSPTDAHAG